MIYCVVAVLVYMLYMVVTANGQWGVTLLSWQKINLKEHPLSAPPHT